MHPLIPDWPAPAAVRAACTTRGGGVSQGAYASLNLAAHVGDDPARVAQNRQRLSAALALPSAPGWLDQVHGTRVVRVAEPGVGTCADGAVAERPGEVAVVMTADCLPLLLCDVAGTRVAALHAGWRGLAAGIIEAGVAAMSTPPGQLLVWLGPAIGPAVFEVGAEVRSAFVTQDAAAAADFAPALRVGHWYCDLFGLARRRLARLGVERVFGGGDCTYSQPERFFSYRRDGATGRMASLIWLAHADEHLG